MTRDDILLIANRMIEERGGAQIDDKEELLRFAVVLGNRVAAAEREACLKIFEESYYWTDTAAAIRARGAKK